MTDSVVVNVVETVTIEVETGAQGPQGIPGVSPTLYYGSFEDYTNQSNAGATSANLVTFNTTSTSSGVSLVAGSKITFAHDGAYLFNFLGQFAFTGGASNYSITVWHSKNGQIVANSAKTFTTTSAQNAQTLAYSQDIIAVNANDYIQFYWYAPATGMALVTTAAGSNPTRPASASANLNVFNVG